MGGAFYYNCPINEPYCDVGPGGTGLPVVKPFLEDGSDAFNHSFRDDQEDNSCIITPDECWEEYLASIHECDVLYGDDPDRTDHQNCYADAGVRWNLCKDGFPPGCVP